jgi:cytochrome c peroxidase
VTSALLKVISVVFAVASLIAACQWWPSVPPAWTDEEIGVLRTLWLESLPDLPPDPSNAVADKPAAAEFGKNLFFDMRLSANGAVSCATCHQPERGFTDGLRKAQGIGMASRHTPSISGTAYSPWQFWDGRRDSQWSQALVPLEEPNEQGFDRRQVVALIAEDAEYHMQYENLFGALPDLASVDAVTLNIAFANVGKAIAAFERTVMPTNSRFDEYVAAVVSGDLERQTALFSDDEIRGLRLFIGKANCTQCHNGPLLTNFEFHNTGVISFPGDIPDKGRVTGVVEVLASEFNCRSQYSDDPSHDCAELDFARTGPTLIGAFKTPSLRNLAAPFMHKGQLPTLADVLRNYSEAPEAMIGHNEAKALDLKAHELRQLEVFLNTLAAPVAVLPATIQSK